MRLKTLIISLFTFVLGNVVGRLLDPPNLARLMHVDRKCIGWRQTAGCDPQAEQETWNDRECEEWIRDGWSGYCECDGGLHLSPVTCQHSGFTCAGICAGKSTGDEQEPGERTVDADAGAAEDAPGGEQEDEQEENMSDWFDDEADKNITVLLEQWRQEKNHSDEYLTAVEHAAKMPEQCRRPVEIASGSVVCPAGCTAVKRMLVERFASELQEQEPLILPKSALDEGSNCTYEGPLAARYLPGCLASGARSSDECDAFSSLPEAMRLCSATEACSGVTGRPYCGDWRPEATSEQESMCYQLRADMTARHSEENETSWRKHTCTRPGLQANSRRSARPETVLILSPIRDRDGPGRRGTMGHDLDRFFGLLKHLDYPKSLISVGILEGDSADATFERTREHLAAMKKLGYRRLLLIKKDFENEAEEMEGNGRHDEYVQMPRRSKLARIRNTLLVTALQDEDWVLWMDSDLSRYGPNLIQALLSSGKSITVPNCVFEKFGGRPYDLNNWQETEISEAMKSLEAPEVPIFEGALDQDNGRLHLDDIAGDLVALDGIGGAVILIRADLHRDGLVFPSFVFENQLETEGLARMAIKMGHIPFALKSVEVIHK